ncbi:MAG TPA: lysophospholipid acyltransferase family protein [Kofleriaceae bacterium]|nr:lysophospholipid acyltransferase family protein [Kofleriaceae bacterium]
MGTFELPAFHDAGHGYDVFGMSPRAVASARDRGAFWYETYFRVRSHGIHNVPARGAAILAANHAGVLPVDAVVLWLDIARNTRRVLRPIADRFIPLLPFISTLFARTGVVSGTHANVRYLLEHDELLGIFPEGVAGVAKPFSARYQLQGWRIGHAELAIRHRAPVIPVAIIGSEEAWPLVGKLQRFHAFGAPYLPIPASPVPLPVPFHIHYGSPLALHDRWPPEAADDPEIVETAAREVHDAVADLISVGLAERRPS